MMLFGLIGESFSLEQNLVIIIAFILAIMIALIAHETAHAWMALKQGDPSAKNAGRLSLNPSHHFEPLGFICFCIVGIGWAKPVPVNPFNYRNFKRGNFFVSISGVTVNIFLAFLFSFGLFMLSRNNLFYWDISSGLIYSSQSLFWFGLGFFFTLTAVINTALVVFNLLPIPPLDGYNMLVSFTKPNNGFMRVMRENSMIILLIVIIFGGYYMSTVRDFILSTFENFWRLVLP